jgi:hypothetical protein
VHDIVDLERRGVVGMFVASMEFVTAAEAQATSLGYPDVARVFTPHPIQDRTDEEMRNYADAAFDDIVAAVTRP